jgi:hypothetical protein
MIARRIPLDRPLSIRYTRELERRMFFISDDIVDFKLLDHNNIIEGVEVVVDEAVDLQQLAGKVNYIVDRDVARQKILPSRSVWKSPRGRSCYPNMFEQLREQNMVFVMGEGLIGLGEPLIKLINYFDARFKQIVFETFPDATEYQYPTLIPTSVLDLCGYFESFPHFLMFVTRLHNDVEVYRSFLDDHTSRADVRTFALGYCRNVDYCLPPTMCFHTYHHYRDRVVGDQERVVVTARGKSFRYESKYHHTLERLWDFTIREIVFMGSRDDVLACRQEYMRLALDLMVEHGLAGYCEVANDPFFCSEDTASKTLSQKMLELKYELRLDVGEGRTIAVGSFNFHEQFFGERFNIQRAHSEHVRTGCVGFGLERLVYAFLCQYGLDQSTWPASVARACA